MEIDITSQASKSGILRVHPNNAQPLAHLALVRTAADDNQWSHAAINYAVHQLICPRLIYLSTAHHISR